MTSDGVGIRMGENMEESQNAVIRETDGQKRKTYTCACMHLCTHTNTYVPRHAHAEGGGEKL